MPDTVSSSSKNGQGTKGRTEDRRGRLLPSSSTTTGRQKKTPQQQVAHAQSGSKQSTKTEVKSYKQGGPVRIHTWQRWSADSPVTQRCDLLTFYLLQLINHKLLLIGVVVIYDRQEIEICILMQKKWILGMSHSLAQNIQWLIVRGFSE